MFSFVRFAVALRKESVDRNFDTVQIVIIVVKSLSARRAWIEISGGAHYYSSDCVALRKESVDRNATVNIVIFCIMGRSPQGERG